MKKILFFIFCISAVFSSCEHSQNGDLDGVWYLTQVDSIQQHASISTRGEKKTWAFQAQFVQFFDYNYSDWNKLVMARIEYNDDKIIINSPFIYNRVDGDIPLTADSLQYLQPYFVNSIPDTFNIEKLTHKELRISDNTLRLYFEKY